MNKLLFILLLLPFFLNAQDVCLIKKFSKLDYSLETSSAEIDIREDLGYIVMFFGSRIYHHHIKKHWIRKDCKVYKLMNQKLKFYPDRMEQIFGKGKRNIYLFCIEDEHEDTEADPATNTKML